MTPRRRGARSIQGSLGAYLKASIVAVVVLAVTVLPTLGDDEDDGPPAAAARLAAGGPWLGAALDDGRAIVEVRAGEVVRLAPGEYTLRLFAVDGGDLERRVTLAAGPVDLDALADGDGADG